MEITTEIQSNTLIITNLKWNKIQTYSFGFNKDIKHSDLPETTMIEIPNNFAAINAPEEQFKDAIESFVYNLLSKKYGYEVNNCQIWLP